eukprot:TRINITY_DN1034_c0_g2_i4.p1 TRINITY_DN1034_c0_g2~~TRINITY_DN1034_c0_g2_i4.p1  ORF type:complete len:288 (-),score=43.91 TRINITY_DN1034_c0_g2_i4:26-889(-)
MYVVGEPLTSRSDGEVNSASSSRPSTLSPAEAIFEVLAQHQSKLAAMPPELADDIRQKLDSLQAGDLSVSTALVNQITEPSGIGYMDVYQAPELTLCIFVLRQGARIPLHDHPGMHVFGRLLFGRIHVTSMDLSPNSSEGRLEAVVHASEALPRTYSLSPSEGNLHQLEALEDSAFFDVVAPPYDPRQGRDCTYYKPCEENPDLTSGQRCLLKRFQPPGFSTQTLRYSGPRPDALQEVSGASPRCAARQWACWTVDACGRALSWGRLRLLSLLYRLRVWMLSRLRLT